MLIERECERLVVEYCHLVDHGQAAKIADLFTPDGVWAGPGVTMKGREQLATGFRRRQAQAERMSRHCCLNFRCDVHDADNAEGVVYLVLYRHDGDPERKVSPSGAPEMVGEYRDRFVRTADGWRIAERKIGVSFVAEPV